MDSSNIDIETILQILDEIEEGERLPYVKNISNPKYRIKALRKLRAGERWEIAKNYKDYFGEDTVLLSQVTELGEDKINFVSAFPKIKEQILNLDPNQYDLFVRCINRYLEESESEEWTQIASIFLKRIETGEYDELIADIEGKEIDIEKLCRVIQNPNDFGLVKAEDLDRYEVIKRENCDAIINGKGAIDEKKNATFQKLFGVDIKYAELTIANFSGDIENLPDSDEKDFVLALKAIIDINDEETLKEIYNECDEVGIVNGLAIKRRLKNVYAKMFNEGLYEPKTEDLIEEDLGELQGVCSKVYNAGTNFKMIVHGISPMVNSERKIESYKADWNRESKSQFFCACYIRDDMLSTAGGKINYGFTQMKEDSLIKWDTQDVGSVSEEFDISEMHIHEYCTPETQINRTVGYNEMDYRRIQGGEKKQPDYIVAYRINGKIDGDVNKIKQAALDWGGELPIVIIDVDKCLEKQENEVKSLLEQYNADKTLEKARHILQKLNNIRSFSAFRQLNINIDALEDKIRKIYLEKGLELIQGITRTDSTNWGSLADLETNNEGVGTEERKQGMSVMRKTLQQIRTIKVKREKGE